MAMTELPVRQKGMCCELELPADRSWAADNARLLKALADPTRLAMIWCLRRAAAPVCLCDFTATFDLGQPTISHHMGKLRTAGLVESEKHGLWVYYRLRDDLTPATIRLIDALVADGPAIQPLPSTVVTSSCKKLTRPAAAAASGSGCS